MSKTAIFLEFSSQPARGSIARDVDAKWVNCTVTVTNKSKTDVKQGNVALQDSDTGDTQGAYFGYIRAGGGSDSRTVSLKGGWEIVLVHFEGSDGSSWTGSGSGNNSTDLTINLNDPRP